MPAEERSGAQCPLFARLPDPENAADPLCCSAAPRLGTPHECGVQLACWTTGSRLAAHTAAFSTVLVLRHRLDPAVGRSDPQARPLSENLVGRGCQRLSNGFRCSNSECHRRSLAGDE
uniref:Uncharacterized protein n=1 Tax=Macrostomum lignano TaxID=282301 RepID=A0A1I8FCK4_9PLAT